MHIATPQEHCRRSNEIAPLQASSIASWRDVTCRRIELLSVLAAARLSLTPLPRYFCDNARVSRPHM